MSDRTFSWKDHAPATVSTFLFVAQIIIGVYLLSEVSQIQIVAYAGVMLYFLAGIVFGMLPVFEFRRKGCVSKGQSYIHTTKVVDTGIYSIVRHPQYVTYMLWAFSGMLLFQHWIVVLLGVPVFPLTYVDLMREDKDCINRFGDTYKAYIKKVPRANFLLGIIRRFRKNKT